MTNHDPAPDMVEKVAKAIYEKRNGHGAKPFAHQPQAHRKPYFGDARAAIEAMSAILREGALGLSDPRTAGFQDLQIGASFRIVADGLDAALQKRERG